MKTAFVTGITGQDGSYLAELLLEKGYDVVGLIRRSSSFNTGRIDHIFDRLTLEYGDVTDAARIFALINKYEPDEVYNLAAQSHVAVSFSEPAHTANVVALGATNLLEAIREVRPQAKYYQASTSELFGNTPPPQAIEDAFDPRSPYAAAKAYAFHMTKLYREAYGIHAVNGVLFNHESPRRGETFVTRKITRALGRMAAGTQKELKLGNLESKRDWGFAGDYVRAMWMMLQTDKPKDYVVATGHSYSVAQFLDAARKRARVMEGLFDCHIDSGNSQYVRPAEVHYLQGDATPIMTELGWQPTVDFKQLVNMMVDHDIELAKREARLR